MDASLVALESISPGKDIYYGTLRYRTLRYRTLPSKEQGSNQLRGFCDRFFSRPYSTLLSFPPRGVTGTSSYRFEYDLHLIKIPSHLDRESIYNFTTNTLKAYLSIQPSSFRAFMTSKTLRVAKKPRRKQFNVKVCGSKNAVLLFFFLISTTISREWLKYSPCF